MLEGRHPVGQLLGKGHRLREQLDDSPPTIEAVESLAQQYGISLQATARRVAEESRQPCAVVLAYRANRGNGSLLSSRYKLWASHTFDERLGWGVRSAPHVSLQSALQLVAAGGQPPPLTVLDGDGRPVEIAVAGLDIHFAVFLLLSCAPRPRLNLRRAHPLSRLSAG